MELWPSRPAYGRERTKRVGQKTQSGGQLRTRLTENYDNGGTVMKGYYTENGFYGYMEGSYRYFSSKSDYVNALEDMPEPGCCEDYPEFAYLLKGMDW